MLNGSSVGERGRVTRGNEDEDYFWGIGKDVKWL